MVAPSNGRVSLTGTGVGAVATYSCLHGYTLVGKATRTCEATERWSGNAPFCRGVHLFFISATTVVGHSGQSQWSVTVVGHSGRSQWSVTVVGHSGQSQWSVTVVGHSGQSQWSVTVVSHSGQSDSLFLSLPPLPPHCMLLFMVCVPLHTPTSTMCCLLRLNAEASS